MNPAEIGFDDEFMATLMGEFLDESTTYLSQLNDNLLELDEFVRSVEDAEGAFHADEDQLNEMFRAAHSLKGLSAMLSLEDINRLTHKMENVLDAARRRDLPITRNVVDVVFQALDRLTMMIDGLRDGQLADVEYLPILDRIEELLNRTERVDESVELPESDRSKTDGAVSDRTPGVDESKLATGDDTVVDHFEGVTDEAETNDKYVGIFVDEAGRCLDEVSELLVAELTPGQLDDLLRHCHQVKGSAAAAGFLHAAKLTHLMEDMLQVSRDEGRELTDRLRDGLLQVTDHLRQYVDGLRAGDNCTDEFNRHYTQLAALRVELDVQPSENSPSNAKWNPMSVIEPAAATNDASNELTAFDAVEGWTDSQWEQLESTVRQRVMESCTSSQETLYGVIQFEQDLPLAEIKRQLVEQRLSQIGHLVWSHSETKGTNGQPESLEVAFAVVETNADIEALKASVLVEGVEGTEVRRVLVEVAANSSTKEMSRRQEGSTPGNAEVAHTAEKSGDPTKPAGTPVAISRSQPAMGDNRGQAQLAGSNNARSKPTETIRVDIDRLDQLMNLAGQLVINKARFGRLGERLKSVTGVKQAVHSLSSIDNLLERVAADLELENEVHPERAFLQETLVHLREMRSGLDVVRFEVESMARARAIVAELGETVHQLDRVADGIQKSVMDTRMLPIGPLFGRFKRVIRDVTRVNGKDVRLVIHGEKTELDKRMIDEIGDPLIHMIRNAADHGIETPEQRREIGKSPHGTITLNAFHRGNGILIQISDDGRGIDPEKVKAKAIANGLVTEQDAERMTNNQIYQLIWEPGFSTAEKVTEVSGRGVGMDIVRSKIEELNGTVELESHFGEGTTFTIKLPLTMAILPSLLAEISGDVFAIPVESVVEIVRVEPNELSTVHGVLTATIRGRVVSVVDLKSIFGWESRSNDPGSIGDRITLVIVGAEHRELGLVVNGLLGEEDIVIKSLAENFRSVEGLAGASILGDGRVSLILDVSSLLELSCRRHVRAEISRSAPFVSSDEDQVDQMMKASAIPEIAS